MRPHRLLAALLAVAFASSAAAKPEGAFALEVDVPEIVSRSASLPVRIEILQPTDALMVEVEGASDESIEGPWSEGDVVETAVSASFGDGAHAAVRVTAFRRGRAIGMHRVELDAVRDGGRAFVSAAGPQTAQRMMVERLASEGRLAGPLLDEMRRALRVGTAPTDALEHPASPLTPAQRMMARVLAPTGVVQLPQDGALPSRIARVPMAAATITVKGKMQWSDRNGGKHPIALAKVEVYDQDPGPAYALLGSGTTDLQGNYSIQVTHDDGAGEGDPDIVVQVLAE